MRVLVTGDRHWRFPELIEEDLAELKEKHGLALVVVHGGNGEADLAAYAACAKLGIDQIVCPPNWSGRGRAGGMFRNGLMFALVKPQLVLAYHRFLPNSKGTKGTVQLAWRKGITVRLHDGVESAIITEMPTYTTTTV